MTDFEQALAKARHEIAQAERGLRSPDVCSSVSTTTMTWFLDALAAAHAEVVAERDALAEMLGDRSQYPPAVWIERAAKRVEARDGDND